MDSLPEELLLDIFEFCGGYAWTCRKVCSQWKRIVTGKGKILLLEDMCRDGLVTKIKNKDVLCEAFKRDLEHILLASCVKIEELCEYAAKKGNLLLLQKAVEDGYSLTNHICFIAAGCGHLEVLKWLHEQDCHLFMWTCACDYAAEGGQLEVLKWLHEQGCPWDEDTFASAARSGNLDVLKWLRENGCPWNEETCASAAEGGYLEVLKWLREQDCPWDEDTFIRAVKHKRTKVLKWLLNNDCPHPWRE